MVKSIMISPVKAKANAKKAEINLCYEQRSAQVHKYESRNPFSMQQWINAFTSGWLREHGLSYWSFPSPTAHFRRLWEKSDEPWFVEWRAESKRKHKQYLKDLRSK